MIINIILLIAIIILLLSCLTFFLNYLNDILDFYLYVEKVKLFQRINKN